MMIRTYMSTVGYVVMDEDTKDFLRVNGTWLSLEHQVKLKGEAVRVYRKPESACQAAISYRCVRTKPIVLYHNEALPHVTFTVVEWRDGKREGDQKHWHHIWNSMVAANAVAENLYREQCKRQERLWKNYYVTVQDAAGYLHMVVCDDGLLTRKHPLFEEYREVVESMTVPEARKQQF